MTLLKLNFVNSNIPELWSTEFSHPLLGAPAHCIRGKNSGAYVNYGSFQWTRSVQALCYLFLSDMALDESTHATRVPAPFVLSGGRSSLACSLNYAIEKRCNWIVDIFGTDSSGGLIAKRAFRRTNPGLRGSCPVALALNRNFLPRSSIEIFVDSCRLKNLGDLREMAELVRRQDSSQNFGESLITAA